MDKKELDSELYIKMSFSDFEDLQTELELAGALVKRMGQINERVHKNFEKIWNICFNAYLIDKEDGKK